jgi:hypothetical protein
MPGTRIVALAALLLSAASCNRAAPLPAVPAGPPPPPPEKLASVVGELNELCADTWCEGSYELTFKKLECTTALACSLTFDAKNHDSGHASVATLALTGFDAMLDSEGYPTDTFENAVNDAIAEWETKQGGQ